MPDAFDPRTLRTVHLVPLTPFDASDRINVKLLSRHLSRMYAAGMRVYMPAAGTSEFHSLSADEVIESVRITREATGPDAQIFAAVGLQIGHAVEIARRAVQAGATGIMFMPFAHPYLSNEGARDYYRRVLDAGNCPALIYKKSDVPGDALLLELADDPRVVGVKYAVNNMHEFRKVVLADGGRLEWICGSAERFAPFYMLAGATGFTTGAGNVCPHLSLAMHAALISGAYAEGLRLQQMILPIEDFRAQGGDSYNVTMLKHAMSLVGDDFGPPRAPQRQLTAAERTEIEQLVRPILSAEAELAEELSSVGLSRG